MDTFFINYKRVGLTFLAQLFTDFKSFKFHSFLSLYILLIILFSIEFKHIIPAIKFTKNFERLGL